MLQGDRLVETFGKLISSALQEHTFNMIQLAKLCQLCYKIFSKDRDKTILARMIVNELIQVLKYKSTLPEANVLILLEVKNQSFFYLAVHNCIILKCKKHIEFAVIQL